MEDRRAAIRAQLDALTERELRAFVADMARRDVQAVELPLAEFLAIRARQREIRPRSEYRRPDLP